MSLVLRNNGALEPNPASAIVLELLRGMLVIRMRHVQADKDGKSSEETVLTQAWKCRHITSLRNQGINRNELADDPFSFGQMLIYYGGKICKSVQCSFLHRYKSGCSVKKKKKWLKNSQLRTVRKVIQEILM